MNRNYHLHRISHCADVSFPLLLGKNILSIGYSGLSSKDTIKNFLENPDTLDEAFLDLEGNLPRNRGILRRFLQMKKGDTVIVPYPYDPSFFSIYRISSDFSSSVEQIDIVDLQTDDGEKIVKSDDGKSLVYDIEDKPEVDLGFFREVEPIHKKVPRKYATGALSSRQGLDNQWTNLNISKLKDLIEDTIKAFQKGEEINLRDLIIKEKSQDKILSAIKDTLDHRKFERLVLWYMRKAGASSAVKPSGNESGKKDGADADVVATFEPIITKIYVQVKFHDGETSGWALQQIKEYRAWQKEENDDEYSRIAWVVSTGTFSDEVRKQAKISDVQLIDGKEFTKMLMEVGIANLGDLS